MPAPKTPAKNSPKTSAPDGDARLVRQLADILNDTGLSEIEVERSGLKVRVTRAVAGMGSAPVHYAAAPAPMAAPAPAAAPSPAAAPTMSSDPAGVAPRSGSWSSWPRRSAGSGPS